MDRSTFLEKISKYFNDKYSNQIADYCEKLDGTVNYGAIGDMNGYEFVCIRMREEADKGVAWLTTYIEDILEYIPYHDTKSIAVAICKMMEDMEVEW